MLLDQDGADVPVPGVREARRAVAGRADPGAPGATGLTPSGATHLIEIVFETHAVTEDNERGIATGWLPGRLSAQGRELARALGNRRRDDGIAAVITSDLHRAVETAEIALGGTGIPVLHDWRLRECDYGELNGAARDVVHERRDHHLDVPYPGGESWRQAVDRAARVLDDLPLRWRGRRVLIIGHVATRLALDEALGGRPLDETLTADFEWQEGWEYRLPAGPRL